MELQQFIAECQSILEELSVVADRQLRDRIAAARDRLRKEKLSILVVGEFSRGKSTFINALIGEPVLPSKVNPTTATINVLSGGSPRFGEVELKDGTRRSLELPDCAVNKYLDDIVTTKNTEATQIRTVHLRIPGRLERLRLDIVDTPGVNDLDASREEVTFSYLREADAAVLLLDAQQPLSESERAFLKEKVFGSDVHRVLFVINKIDEVLSGGTREDIPRILEYVQGRLRDLLGLQSAPLYAVSAKNALRARYKQEPDPGPTSFDDFEQALIAFAMDQATNGRLTAHLQRISGLIREQLDHIAIERAALERSVGDADQGLRNITERSDLLRAASVRVEERATRDAKQLGESVATASEREVRAMHTELRVALERCKTDDDIESFRTSLTQKLRALAESVESFARTERARVLGAIEAEFGPLLAPISPAFPSKRVQPFQATSLEATREKLVRSDEAPSGGGLPETLTGFGLGYIGSSLFGPMGIAAAVVGTYLIGKERRERREAALAKQEREAMLQALQQTCSELADRARAMGREIAAREAEAIAEHVRERVRRGADAVNVALEAQQRASKQTKTERESSLRALDTRATVINGIEDRVRALSRSAHAATP